MALTRKDLDHLYDIRAKLYYSSEEAWIIPALDQLIRKYQAKFDAENPSRLELLARLFLDLMESYVPIVLFALGVLYVLAKWLKIF